MPQYETVHVKKTLTGVATAYFQEPDVFIADLLSPMVRVAKHADYYFIFGREHFNLADSIRRPGDTPTEVVHTVSKDMYVCAEHIFREKVTDEEREDADSPIEPEADATRYVSERLRLTREHRIASQLTDANNYQTGWKATLSGADQWDDYEQSSPIDVIQAAIDQVAMGGKAPNTFWMGYEPWSKLKHHPDFIARLPDQKTRIVTPDLLKLIWEEIDTVAIGRALYNSAREGQDESLSYVWGKCFGVAYINRSLPNKKAPSFNYSFMWPYKARSGRVRREGRDMQPGAANGTIYQARVYRHADEGAKSDWVEVALREGFKITGAYLGYLISDVIG